MRGLVVIIAVVVCGMLAADAMACSCSARPDAQRLAEAKAAFVGTLLERRDLRPPGTAGVSTADPFVNVYRVDETHKGSLGQTIEIRTVRDSATCGLSQRVGSRIALYPRRQDGAWTAGECDRGTIAGMRSAAKSARKPAARRTRSRPRATGCEARES